jgi:hypothetical protein
MATRETRRKITIFGKFEYSPKWPFSEMCRTRQTRRHLPTWFARSRQNRRHSPKAIFEKNVTHLAKFAQVLSESPEFGARGHSLVKMPSNNIVNVNIDVELKNTDLRWSKKRWSTINKSGFTNTSRWVHFVLS